MPPPGGGGGFPGPGAQPSGPDAGWGGNAPPAPPPTGSGFIPSKPAIVPGQDLPFAGFGNRLVSGIIDNTLSGLIVVLCSAGGLFLAPKEDGFCRNSSGDIVSCTPPTDTGRLIIFGAIALGIFLAVFYFANGVGKKGATLGHKAMGIRVVNVTTGQPIGLGRGFVWALVRTFFSWFLMLGYLWALFSPRKQTWHDMAAGAAAVLAPK